MTRKQKRMLWRILIAAGLLVLAVLMPEMGWVGLLFFLIP